MRTMRLPWNEGRLTTISTVADQWNYTLPTDFIGFIGKPYFSRSGDSTSRRPLEIRSADWMEEYKYLGSDPEHIGTWVSGIESGPPNSVTIYNVELLVVPIPDATGDWIDGRYLKDIGTPYYKYAGGAWTFYNPSTNVAIAATYTNAWF